jgi:hypothetical protein
MRQLILIVGISSVLLIAESAAAFGRRSRRGRCCRAVCCCQVGGDRHSSAVSPAVRDDGSMKSDCTWSFEAVGIGDGVRITGKITCNGLTCGVDEKLTNSKPTAEVRCTKVTESGLSRIKLEVRLSRTEENSVRVTARRCVDISFISACTVWEDLGVYFP